MRKGTEQNHDALYFNGQSMTDSRFDLLLYPYAILLNGLISLLFRNLLHTRPSTVDLCAWRRAVLFSLFETFICLMV